MLILAAIVAASAARSCWCFGGLPLNSDEIVLPAADGGGVSIVGGGATAMLDVGAGISAAGGACSGGDNRTTTRKNMLRVPKLMTAPVERGCKTPGCILLPFIVVPFAENRSTTCTFFAASTLCCCHSGMEPGSQKET